MDNIPHTNLARKMGNVWYYKYGQRLPNFCHDFKRENELRFSIDEEGIIYWYLLTSEYEWYYYLEDYGVGQWVPLKL